MFYMKLHAVKWGGKSHLTKKFCRAVQQSMEYTDRNIKIEYLFNVTCVGGAGFFDNYSHFKFCPNTSAQLCIFFFFIGKMGRLGRKEIEREFSGRLSHQTNNGCITIYEQTIRNILNLLLDEISPWGEKLAFFWSWN